MEAASKKTAVGLSTADALLNATSALMTERNSVDVTFMDIAARSGVNSALIRYHFGNKVGLFKRLLERDAGKTIEDLDALVRADIPPAQKIHHHIFGVINTYFRFPYMNRLIAALSNDAESETARFIAERFTRPIAAAQKAILEQGQRDGTFRAIDPMLFHFSLIGACDNIFQARYSLQHAFGIEEISDDLRRRYADHVSSLVLKSIVAD